MDAQQFEEEEEEAPGSSSACAVSSSKEKPHVFRVAHLRPIEEVMLEVSVSSCLGLVYACEC